MDRLVSLRTKNLIYKYCTLILVRVNGNGINISIYTYGKWHLPEHSSVLETSA